VQILIEENGLNGSVKSQHRLKVWTIKTHLHCNSCKYKNYKAILDYFKFQIWFYYWGNYMKLLLPWQPDSIKYMKLSRYLHQSY